MIKVSNNKLIALKDWDEFVNEVYGKPYNLQQQEGCMERHLFRITVPVEEPEDYVDSDMGVSFETWLNTSPEQIATSFDDDWLCKMHWHRNFYPSPDMVFNDLFNRGLIEAGDYLINIDW